MLIIKDMGDSHRVIEKNVAYGDVCSLEKPESGEVLTINLGSGTHYDLKFDPHMVKSVSHENGALVCTFEDNAKIIFENFDGSKKELSNLAGLTSDQPAQEGLLNSIDLMAKLTFLATELQENFFVEDNSGFYRDETASMNNLALKLASIEPSDGEILTDASPERFGPPEQLLIEAQTIENAGIQSAGSGMVDMGKFLDAVEPASGGAGGTGSSHSGYGFESAVDSAPLVSLDAIGAIGQTALVYDAEFYRPRGGESNNEDNNFNLAMSAVPEITVTNAAETLFIKEDSQGIASLTASYEGGDGQEIMTLTVSGVLPSWTVITPGWTFLGGGSYEMVLVPGQNEYNGSFAFRPPAQSDADMTGLLFTASVTNADKTVTKITTQDFSVHVDAVVDAPVLVVPASIQQAWYYNHRSYSVPLKISSLVTDTDGSEIITKIVIRLDNPFTNPAGSFRTLDDMGIGLNKGTEVSPGVWEIPVQHGDASAALNGLLLLVPSTMDYHAIHQSIKGGHATNITVISYVSEINTNGEEWDYSDNHTTVVQNINLNFVITPLVLDLNGDGIQLVTIEAGVLFDMNNDGTNDKTSWVGPDDGLLAIDLNHDGAINNRSMGLDTECDQIIIGNDDAARKKIAAVRTDLIREHSGREAEEIDRLVESNAPISAFLEMVPTSRQHFKRIDDEPYRHEKFVMLAKKVADPRRPIISADLTIPLSNKHFKKHLSKPWVWLLISLIVLIIVSCVPVISGETNIFSLKHIIIWLKSLSGSAFAIPFIFLIYIISGLILFPLTILIGATAAAFGPLYGFMLSVAGTLLSAGVGYVVGQKIGLSKITNVFGKKVERIRDKINHGGILGVTIIRMLPISPFGLMNILFGINGISFRSYIAGTFLGILPGTVALSFLGSSLFQIINQPSQKNILSLFLGLSLWIAVIISSHFLEKKFSRKD